MTKDTINFKVINLLSGINTYPGSGPAEYHELEYRLFNTSLDFLDQQGIKQPTMLEVGCFWALWSLVFRKRFPDGRNVLVELGRRQLEVGRENFRLNDFDYESYWGGFFLDKSGTYKNRQYDIEFPKVEGEYYCDDLSGEMVGPELNFMDIYRQSSLDTIDLLHMDIQGSELPLIRDINLLLDKKIRSLVIATHSAEIHQEIVSRLNNNGFNLEIDISSLLGSDGYIYANKI